MNINYRYFFLVLGLQCISSFLSAQNVLHVGALPSFNFNGKITDYWSMNTKIESRFPVVETTTLSPASHAINYELTDLSVIGAKKIGLDNRVGIGYLIRLRKNEVNHRTIQQFTLIQRFSGFRLVHRFSSDQTFSPQEALEFRLRYRITSEIPFNGKSADPKEGYFKLNNEYLGSWQNGTFDPEIRLVPLIGYTVTPNSKLELGVDYRIRSFHTNSARNNVWLNINWFYQLEFNKPL